MVSILKYFFSFSLFLWATSIYAQSSQTAVDDSAAQRRVQLEVMNKVNKNKYIYQGAYLNLDIYDPIATMFNGGRFQFEVSADVSLWQRLFPAIDFGMMFMDQKNTDYRYESNGFFFRAGANYNFINYKDTRRYDHILAIGVRYGYAHLGYKLSDAVCNNTYWNESTSAATEWKSVDTGWVEFLATVRVQIYKSFFMGLTVRVQTFQHFYQASPEYPTYIPGYGVYGSSATNWGVDFNLCYQFPYKKKPTQ